MGSIKEYFHAYLWRDTMLRIVTVNFLVWVVVAVGTLLCQAMSLPIHTWIGFFALPSDLTRLPARCWTVLTYMFVQTDFMHLVVNMMWLMLFGRLFQQMQGERRLLTLYIYGGLAGAVGYLVYAAVFAVSRGSLYGASAAVLAVCGAVALLIPKGEVELVFIGRVRIIWLCAVCILFFVVLTESAIQAVSHAAGLAVGIAFALCRKHGADITAPAIALWSAVAAKVRGVPVARPQTAAQASASGQRELDALLRKVSCSGYASLTPSERQRLFDLSQKIKL